MTYKIRYLIHGIYKDSNQIQKKVYETEDYDMREAVEKAKKDGLIALVGNPCNNTSRITVPTDKIKPL